MKDRYIASDWNKLVWQNLCMLLIACAIYAGTDGTARAQGGLCAAVVAIDPEEAHAQTAIIYEMDVVAAVVECERQLRSDPSPEAHYALARALHVAVRAGHSSAVQSLFDASPVTAMKGHLERAVEASLPAAQHFAGLLREVKFGPTSKIYCDGGYRIADCFRAAALAGYQPAKAKYIEQWAAGNLDDLAWQYIDELQHSDDPRSLLAVIGALDHWRFRERKIRRREQTGGELDEQDVYQRSQYLAASDKLFTAYRGLFEAGQLEAGYDLAEMAFVDRRRDVTLENVQHWLRSSFGKTRGMSEAFAGLMHEQSGADAATVRPYFAAAAELGNPFAMAKMARQNLPGGSATLDEATALVDLEAAFAAREDWFREARDIEGVTKLDVWIDLAYRELQLTLGPVAFRQATGLINSDDEREQARAVELYKLASRLGIQKAHLALGYLYRKGQGVPVSRDYERRYFEFAAHCNPGFPTVYNCNMEIAREADRELRANFGRPEASSVELLGIVGLALLFLGTLDGDNAYRNDYQQWQPERPDHLQGIAGGKAKVQWLR